MDSHKLSGFLFFAAISLCIVSSNGYNYNIGGQSGWVEHPQESYDDWSKRHNFAVNDTLFFKYQHGDSVLQVSKEAYDTCNNSVWIWKEDDGGSTFRLDKTGEFYFISGIKDHCDRGQKLSVNVTSGGQPPAPAPAPAPHVPSPAPAPEPSSPPSPTPEPSAASDVLGTPSFTAALMGFVFGMIVVF